MTRAAKGSHSHDVPKITLDAEKITLHKDLVTQKDFSISLKKILKNFLEFDVVGVTSPIANALRRTMIAEVPTMAIETVFVVNNTSVIPDEVLSHRLGLVPIHADPRKFDFANGDSTDANTIVFELQAQCSDSKEKKDLSVKSSSLKWVPQGTQESAFVEDPIRPVQDDILLVKLSPGQALDLELHCVKGRGKDHAKWSPVSLATYRLLPEIVLLEDIEGEDGRKLQQVFSPGVIGLEKSKGTVKAVVQNPRIDSVSREFLRHPEFANRVVQTRASNHFIFQLETVGFFSPLDVVRESLSILKEKACRLEAALRTL